MSAIISDNAEITSELLRRLRDYYVFDSSPIIRDSPLTVLNNLRAFLELPFNQAPHATYRNAFEYHYHLLLRNVHKASITRWGSYASCLLDMVCLFIFVLLISHSVY